MPVRRQVVFLEALAEDVRLVLCGVLQGTLLVSLMVFDEFYVEVL